MQLLGPVTTGNAGIITTNEGSSSGKPECLTAVHKIARIIKIFQYQLDPQNCTASTADILNNQPSKSLPSRTTDRPSEPHSTSLSVGLDKIRTSRVRATIQVLVRQKSRRANGGRRRFCVTSAAFSLPFTSGSCCSFGFTILDYCSVLMHPNWNTHSTLTASYAASQVLSALGGLCCENKTLRRTDCSSPQNKTHLCPALFSFPFFICAQSRLRSLFITYMSLASMTARIFPWLRRISLEAGEVSNT